MQIESGRDYDLPSQKSNNDNSGLPKNQKRTGGSYRKAEEKAAHKEPRKTANKLGGKLAPAIHHLARTVRAVVILCLALMPGLASYAAEQRYDYDPLGRLIRSVEGSQANEYIYDPAGNLLRVTGNVVQPPVITSGDLGDFRQNEYRQAAVSGNNLAGATIRSSTSDISISSVVSSATAINFRLAVKANAPLGSHQLFFETAAGSANVGLNVVPGYAIAIEPMPIAVPPDNKARTFTVRLADPASQNLTFTLSTVSSAIAKTKTNTVTILADQMTTDIGVIGVAAGSTTLRIGSANLVDPADFLVTVSSDAFSQINYSRPVGITRGVPWALPSKNDTLSKSVGIVRGAPWSFATGYSTFSSPLGITRGAPFADANNNLVVSPPVGITKP